MLPFSVSALHTPCISDIFCVNPDLRNYVIYDGFYVTLEFPVHFPWLLGLKYTFPK